MNFIKIFLLGFALWYIIQIMDLLINLFSSYISVLIAKNNTKINNMSINENQSNPNLIGFQYQPEEEFYEEDKT